MATRRKVSFVDALKQEEARAAEERGLALALVRSVLPREVADPPASEELKETIVRAILASRIMGLTEVDILHAFLAVWPHVAESRLSVTVSPAKVARVANRRRSR